MTSSTEPNCFGARRPHALIAVAQEYGWHFDSHGAFRNAVKTLAALHQKTAMDFRIGHGGEFFTSISTTAG